MSIPIEHIIARLGGADAAARLTGVGTEAVRKWRQARAIPPRHWPAVIAATGLAMADLQSSSSEPERPTMSDPNSADAVPAGATAALVLADGAVFWGRGFGAHTPVTQGTAARDPVGEVCFNTGMTGYQETLTDPSYAGQIITFTFPHIGNVGTNSEDLEAATITARGLMVKQDVTEPSNWRSTQSLDAWLRSNGVTGIAGVDTRALTIRIRDGGAPTGVLAFPADGRFDLPALRAQAAAWPGLEGMDLAKEVTCRQTYYWDDTAWSWPDGVRPADRATRHVVAVDYGAKRNILRSLASAGCRVTVVPATATADEILRHQPDGVFLSNGPGDPAATGVYAVPVLRERAGERACRCSASAWATSCWPWRWAQRPTSWRRGHRGANQPVQDLATGRGGDHQPEPRLRGRCGRVCRPA